MPHETALIATIAAGIGLAFVLGLAATRPRPPRTGSREPFTLSVLAVAIGIAVGAAALFGVSCVLGAFFAGMVVHGSDLSHEAAAESRCSSVPPARSRNCLPSAASTEREFGLAS